MILRITQSILVIVLLSLSWTHALAAGLPSVQNVNINGDQLTWDAVDGATGYNVYLQGSYLNTVRDSLDYTVIETGSYYVVAFDDNGNFSPAMFDRDNIPFYEGGIDNRPIVYDLTESLLYVTRRCFDVNAGQTCSASCPDSIGGTNGAIIIGSATGGACSSSDSIQVNSNIRPDKYSCTVSSFTATVVAQSVCQVIP